jgi:hypothetical protein
MVSDHWIGMWNQGYGQHLAANEHQHDGQAVFQQVEAFVHVGEQESTGERRPMMAKMFDVNTMNGSVVTAKMAGMLSTAKTTSRPRSAPAPGTSACPERAVPCHEEAPPRGKSG